MARRNRSVISRLVAVLGVLLGLGLLAQLRVEVPGSPVPPAPVLHPTPRVVPSPSASAPISERPERVTPLPTRPPAAPEPVEAVPLGEVEVSVYGGGVAYPVDCGLQSVVARGPGWIRWSVEPGVCVVRGMRRDGAFTVFGDDVSLQVGPGEKVEVSLPMPVHRTGGIGVRFEMTDGGARVVQVVAGTPAAEAGLGVGDLILEVNGQLTRDMDAVDFVRTMTGDEGTDVEFVVGYGSGDDWVEEVVTATRTFLSG